MSTHIEAAAAFSRNLHEDGREQSEVEMFHDEEQHSDHGLQQTENQKQKNLQAERRNCFRVFKFSLGFSFFLILAGLMTPYLLVSLEINRLKTSNNQLQTELSDMAVNISDPQREEKEQKIHSEGKRCPEGWEGFRCSCYYKSTERRNWTDSRRFCHDVGSDLLVVDSKEEQEFVSKMNLSEDSWIGLYIDRSSENPEWRWVDGSAQTETLSPNYYTVVALSDDGKWRQWYDSTSNINWICEKNNSGSVCY